METTEGFYKYQEDIQQLLHAPNFVLNKDYELRKENKEQYSYPTDGWYWFDSELDAKQFFNVPEKKEEPVVPDLSMNLPPDLPPEIRSRILSSIPVQLTNN